MIANCGEPLPPFNGYLEPYTSTTEGTRVSRVHICQNGQQSIEEIICNRDGKWETVGGSAYTSSTNRVSETTVNLLAIISGSLGSLLAMALLVCGVLIVIIVVTCSSRKKGMTLLLLY